MRGGILFIHWPIVHPHKPCGACTTCADDANEPTYKPNLTLTAHRTDLTMRSLARIMGRLSGPYATGLMTTSTAFEPRSGTALPSVNRR